MATIRGVNLGGWFVLESWMRPQLFDQMDGKDETYFMEHHPHPHHALESHYQTFIQEKDFLELSQMGIKYLRLPVPWWYQGTELYHASETWIHQAFKWAETYGQHILLDLHTAPGCQNGFDNGGITGVMDWHKDERNIQVTLDKINHLTRDFSHYTSFYGIEVLNEPHKKIEMSIVIDFYERAYKNIRELTDKIIVFHDAFRPNDEGWESFFHGKENVAFDLHLYHCFDERLTEGPVELHMEEIFQHRLPMIRRISQFVRVIIGEWSLGLRQNESHFPDQFSYEQFIRLLLEAQLFIYDQAFGYFFWSYKIERESHEAWDFSRLVKKGIMPKKF